MTEFLTLVALIAFTTTVTGLLMALAAHLAVATDRGDGAHPEVRSTPQQTTRWMAP